MHVCGLQECFLMPRIERALLSVTDKDGIVAFASKLHNMGVELISTGGTAKLLRENRIPVREVADITGFPEMLDGRVKTLHPKVHGGILHIRENEAHRQSVTDHDIPAIDMVVVNLYAFEKTAAKPGVTFEQIIENIDIGGPSMLRSAAKNFQDVAVVTSPSDYSEILDELNKVFEESHHFMHGLQVGRSADLSRVVFNLTCTVPEHHALESKIKLQRGIESVATFNNSEEE